MIDLRDVFDRHVRGFFFSCFLWVGYNDLLGLAPRSSAVPLSQVYFALNWKWALYPSMCVYPDKLEKSRKARGCILESLGLSQTKEYGENL